MKNAIETTHLPSGWKVNELCNHLDRIANGLTAKQEQEQPGIPVSRIETISDGTINFDRVRYVRELDEQTRNTFLLQQGDILFSHINSDLHLGKTAVYSSNKPLLHGMNLLLLRTRKDTLDPHYLHYLLNYYRRTGKFIEIAQHAVNQSSLNQQKIKSLLIPAPCIDIQELIVAEIEKQFSRLDEAVASLKRTKANLKRYKAAVLKAAVEGKLTEDWRKQHPNVEPASKLLERISAERREKWVGKGKYKEPIALDASDLPSLPRGWTWAAVDQVAEVMLGKMLDQKKHRTGRLLPYLRNINIRWGRIDTDDLLEMFFDDDELDRYGLVSGDVLVCEGGEPGRAAVWDGCLPQLKYQKALHRVRFYSDFEARYLVFLLEFLANTGRLDRWFTGSTIKHFTRESFVSVPIPMPPLLEQREIVAEVERRLSVIDELEATVEANLTRADRLRQAVLSHAFSGRLVSSDDTRCKTVNEWEDSQV